MADCFSLPNAAELVEQLRSASELGDAPAFNEFGVIVSKSTAQHAAGTIEALMQENAKLKAERDHWEEIARERGEHYRQMRRERDAAVEDIIIACRGERTLCGMCGNKNCEYAGDNQTYCYKCTKYKWRGVQKEEEDATD